MDERLVTSGHKRLSQRCDLRGVQPFSRGCRVAGGNAQELISSRRSYGGIRLDAERPERHSHAEREERSV